MVEFAASDVGRDGNDSSDTDPDMPELVPVPRIVAPELDRGRDSGRSCMPRTLLCQSGITLGSRPIRNHWAKQRTLPPLTNPMATVNDMSGSVSAMRLDSSSLSGDTPAPLRFAMKVSTSFGERADALATALDKLLPSVCPSDPPIAEIADGKSVADLDIPVEVGCQIATSNDFDAELAGVQQGLDEDTDSGSEGVDSDVDPEADGATLANPAGSRKPQARPVAAVPRGAPGVAPASKSVKSAVASARRTANEYAAAQEDDEIATDNSFGPRFKGLAPEELTVAKAAWSLHSLANVRCPSARESKRAAASILDELRARAAPGPQLGKNGGGRAADESQKPTFRRPQAHVVAHQQSIRTIKCDDSRPGSRVMEECMAGSRKRKAPAGELGASHIGDMDGKRPARSICADMGDVACD